MARSTRNKDKIRLDELLVRLGLASSLKKARVVILAGEVVLHGSLEGRRPVADLSVPSNTSISIRPRKKFVSRGGYKLEGALDMFGLDPKGLDVIDVGASTGGFTDCLLQRGAKTVFSVDVGYGQLDERLRLDERVVNMDRMNARNELSIPVPIQLAVVDVSFISLRLVLPSIFDVVQPGGWVIALLKPQFEARREEVGSRGVIRDHLIHARVLGRFVAWAVSSGVRIRNIARSKLDGNTGNREFFILIDAVSINQSTSLHRNSHI